MKFDVRRKLLATALVLPFLAACGGGGDDDLGDFGSSDTGATAPSSIVSKKLVETVTKNDGQTTTIAVGRTITYNFVDSRTVMGAGLATKLTDNFSYSVNGNVATVKLVYPNGESTDVLTFTSPNGGTYRSDLKFYASGQTNWHSGTFTVSNVSP
jgi:hypothetical protein